MFDRGSGGVYNSFSKKRSEFSSLDDLRSYLSTNPSLNTSDIQDILTNMTTLGGSGLNYKDYGEAYKILNDFVNGNLTSVYDSLRDGSMTGTEALGYANERGLTGIDPGLQDYISNQIAQDNAKTAYDREIAARDSSLVSTYDQLQQLGMNPGSVISIGGSQTPNLGQAQSTSLNAAQLAQQQKINQYNQKQAMSRQLISMVSSLGRAAIGGTTYGLARSAAAKAVQSTAGAAKAALSRRPIIKDRGHEDDPDSWYIY